MMKRSNKILNFLCFIWKHLLFIPFSASFHSLFLLSSSKGLRQLAKKLSTFFAEGLSGPKLFFLPSHQQNPKKHTHKKKPLKQLVTRNILYNVSGGNEAWCMVVSLELSPWEVLHGVGNGRALQEGEARYVHATTGAGWGRKHLSIWSLPPSHTGPLCYNSCVFECKIHPDWAMRVKHEALAGLYILSCRKRQSHFPCSVSSPN